MVTENLSNQGRHQYKSHQNKGKPFLLWLLITVLAIGIFFRFANLDRKTYSFDETFTSLRSAGYTEAEMSQQIVDSKVITLEELQKYQLINGKKKLVDTIKSLAKEEFHFPPLYFLIVRSWVQWFGNSVAVTRSVSALISLLAFPSIYWLCLELFESPLTGWIAMALIAISPFHVLYAQEARPYSLWTVTILLSSASLLRAIRLQTKLSWVAYTATVVLGLYSYLYSGLVTIAHAIYIVLIEGFRATKRLKSYLLALLTGLLTFAFWPLTVIANRPSFNHVSGFWNNSASLQHLLNRWASNFTRVFLDFGEYRNSFAQQLTVLPLILIVLFLEAYAIYFLCRHTPKRIWLFVLSLIGVQVVGLMLPDLILLRWRLSGETRYLIPSYLGVEIAVAYLLSAKMALVYGNIWRQKLWQIVTALVLLAGVVSCSISLQAEHWWNKGFGKYNAEVAGIINKATQPLLISDDSPNIVISLSYLLNPQVRFLLVNNPKIPDIPEGFSDVFLYNPSPTLQSGIEQVQNYQLYPAKKNQDIGLWKLSEQ